MGLPRLFMMLAEGKYRMAEGTMIGVSFLFIARGRHWSRSNPRSLDCQDRVPVMEAMLGYSFLWALIFYAAPFEQHLDGGYLVLLAHLGGATIWVFSTSIATTGPYGSARSVRELIGYLVMHCFSIWLFGVLIDQYGLAPDVALSSAAYFLIIPFFLWTFKIRGVNKTQVQY